MISCVPVKGFQPINFESDDPIPAIALARMDADLLGLKNGYGIRWNRAGQPDVAANNRTITDHRIAADDGRVRIDGHIVSHRGMAFAAESETLVVTLNVLGQAARDQAHALVQPDAVTDLGGAANHHATQ